MDDSFQVYRKTKRPIISSSDESEMEDDSDIFDSSQPEQTFLSKTLSAPRHFSSKPQGSPEVDIHEKSLQDLGSILSEDSLVSTSISYPVAEQSDQIDDSDSCVEDSSSDSKQSELSDEDQNISDSDIEEITSTEKVLSPVAQDAVDFVKPRPIIQVESNVEVSPRWDTNKRRSFKQVKAELTAVELQLEESEELLSTLDTSIEPDSGLNIADSILSLECIKDELKSQLISLKPNSPFKPPIVEAEVKYSTPKRKDTMFSPVKRELPDTHVLDDDCTILEEKLSPLNENGNAASSEISIANIRSVLKEKVSQDPSDIVNSPKHDESAPAAWSTLPTAEVDTGAFGKQAMKTFTTQQSLTVETLHTLHSALKSCPAEDAQEEDPAGLKVQLMPHQKHALAWLLWRERERPSGGILADDMGLGKTLTMISLILKAEQENKENDEDSDEEDDDGWMESKRQRMPRGGTLVVCPASLVGQWEGEIKRRCDKGLLSVLLYHGSYRETRVKRIARKDVVITTYNLMGRESGVETAKNCTELKSPGPLHCIKWKRVILDEAHIVRNHKSQTALGVFELSAKHRWCLTGTPIQNKELDLFSLLKFLRCSPFDDLVVWKRWVDNKNAAGMQRLSTMMKSLMLRRTKEQLNEKGALLDLPTKEYEVISVKLDREELKIYKKVALFSSTLFMQFLGQRAEKDQHSEARWGQSNLPTWEQGDRPENQFLTNEKIVEMYRKMKVKNTEIKSHQILVLLLRLRQICCHPGLIKEMLQKEDFSAAGVEDETDDVDEDLFSAMEKLAINSENGEEEEKEEDDDRSSSPTTVGPSALSPDNPILEFSRPSSKIRAVLDVILDKVLDTEDKAVVVSQWTSMLNIVHDHLKEMGVKCEMLSGNVPVPKRMEMVQDFNSKRNKFKVLLLSLTAGGVGLNLIGGNHLFLIDVHWNPQLEAQACDRIYRVGQKKPVHIYKFVCADTVEERIKALQERKLALADNVLTGTKNTQASKLTLQDLKMLFGIGAQPEL